MAEPPRAVAPRPSASVILVRDGDAGLETFMVRRHARSRVAPSAYVFPGGTVRADDTASDGGLVHALAERSDAPVDDRAAGGYFVAAVRELFEEAGVLLARDPMRGLLAVDDADTALQERLASARLALQAGQLSLADLLAEHDWQPAFDLLVPFSHWVTPAVLAARFDTRFFVAEMPPRQAALHCTIETSEGIWIAPRALLEGDYQVVYATAQHLRRIAPFDSVAALWTSRGPSRFAACSPRSSNAATGLTVQLPPEIADSW